MRSASEIYERSPEWLQTVMLNVYAARIHRQRYGLRFDRVREELERTQYFSEAEIAAYQDAKLASLVRHAYETVPYYRDLFDGIGLKPSDVRTAADLPKIPVLKKDIVKKNFRRLISRAFRESRLVPGRTSGTTGSPLELRWDLNTCVYTNAVDWRHKAWGGVAYGEPIALFLGRAIVPVHRETPPFWKRDYLHNQLWMSAFHLKEGNLGRYAERLLAFRPAALEGYPSVLALMARYFLKNGLKMPVRAAFTSSETLYPPQREVIERVFSCRVLDYLGMAERVVFATECGWRSGHHLSFEYALNEIVDERDEPVSPGRRGYLVGTSLQNYGMPLIRYRTNDLTSFKEGECRCGRKMPRIDEVTTKAEDMIVTPEGRVLSPSVLTHPFKPIGAIKESQIVQTEIDRMTITIVRDEGYADRDTQRLVDAMRERVGGKIRIEVRFAEEIPRGPGGKFRWVISRVPPPL